MPLTNEQIDKLSAKELNALIAVEVMQTHSFWERPADDDRTWGVLIDRSNGALRGYDDIPDFSERIEAAWQVVESHPLGIWNWRINQGDNGLWWVEIRLGYETSYRKAVIAKAEKLTEAICRCALRAVGASE